MKSFHFFEVKVSDVRAIIGFMASNKMSLGKESNTIKIESLLHWVCGRLSMKSMLTSSDSPY